jgi:hypothetical protein
MKNQALDLQEQSPQQQQASEFDQHSNLNFVICAPSKETKSDSITLQSAPGD